jgi:TRAP-type mannitol/chloroaromatic compound transport system permease small subunit
MSNKLQNVLRAIDAFSERVGRVTSLLAIVLMLIVVTRVITRYVFGIPFTYGFPILYQAFGVFILFAGVYAMLKGAHLRVEVLHIRFSSRAKYYAGILYQVAFIIFMGVLIWQSGWMASNSLVNRELSQGAPKVPLYIIKSFIPAVAFLFLLQGISAYFRKDKDTDSHGQANKEG